LPPCVYESLKRLVIALCSMLGTVFIGGAAARLAPG